MWCLRSLFWALFDRLVKFAGRSAGSTWGSWRRWRVDVAAVDGVADADADGEFGEVGLWSLLDANGYDDGDVLLLSLSLSFLWVSSLFWLLWSWDGGGLAIVHGSDGRREFTSGRSDGFSIRTSCDDCVPIVFLLSLLELLLVSPCASFGIFVGRSESSICDTGASQA